MTPYLRGFYLTMNSWRKGRDKLGWKLPARAYRAFLSLSKNQVVGDSDVESFATDEKAPVFVEAVPLMREHLSVLMDMFVEPEPALKLVRGKESIQIIYSFGDASGEGFGNTLTGKRKRESTTVLESGDWRALILLPIGESLKILRAIWNRKGLGVN